MWTKLVWSTREMMETRGERRWMREQERAVNRGDAVLLKRLMDQGYIVGTMVHRIDSVLLGSR